MLGNTCKITYYEGSRNCKYNWEIVNGSVNRTLRTGEQLAVVCGHLHSAVSCDFRRFGFVLKTSTVKWFCIMNISCWNRMLSFTSCSRFISCLSILAGICELLLHCMYICYYSTTVGVRSIAISLSVCVSVSLCVFVCLQAYLWNRWTDLYKILYKDPQWLWLGSSLSALQCVTCFQSYGWHHVWL